MRAVVIARAGGPEVLEERDVGEGLPPPGEGEVLVGVSAAGVNRADTVQRQGRYPAPPGASPYPGLECSGTILALGPNVPSRWAVGDQIHGGSSGIGTFAIQIAKHLGIKVFVTAGSEEKLAACKGLGADVCINYKTEDFVARVKEETNGKVTLDMEVYLPGVDVILDNIGGLYLQRNLNSLAVDGRLFIIGFQGGAVTEVNLQPMLARRLTIQAAGLRNRSLDNKALIVSEVEKNVWPAVVQGKVKPVIYKTFPLSEAAEAHKLMEESSHIGKILLIP
uniref:Enoyl reductase (ER) domain-containing protein n=1 Tax=Oryza rufipogon TaxID=4529 RepID=A0A0E0NMG4_ORYRU